MSIAVDRMRAIVLVGAVNEAALHRIEYARAIGGKLEALHVPLDDAETASVRCSWRDRSVQVPLTVVAPEGNHIVKPILRYVLDLRQASPRELVLVVVPENRGWWQRLIRGWRTRSLTRHLAALDGVAIVLVPRDEQGRSQ